MNEVKTSTAVLEAVMFAAGDPMSMEDLAGILQTDLLTAQNLMTRLQRELEEEERGLTVRRVAGGWQLATRPDLYQVVERLSQVVDRKLSAPTMETLSIIAFKQPITKQEINRYINKTTQPNVGLKSIQQFLFPLPPLAEQHRIVAKIEELLPLCEQLIR